ncbi:tetratricopeptide repeat protein, partial [Psychrobacillus sp.]|uniref:tetratricopeptide repeat protein n=1 Tax=Psychrobacillus sp. TaxID=1871623 RepID=UPI0028BEF552
MDRLNKFKLEFEGLITRYVKEIDATVELNVEVFNEEDKLSQPIKNDRGEKQGFFSEEEKSSVTEDSDVNTTLVYNNSLEVQSEKICILINFHGFSENVINYSNLGSKKKYSIINFLLDTILEKIDSKETTDLAQIIYKIEEMKSEDISLQLTYVVNKFFEELVLDIYTGDKNEGIENFLSLKHLDIVSTLNYEGAKVNAKLIIIDEDYKEAYINFIVKLHTPISYSSYGKVRKLLELSGEGIFVIGDHKLIYGLGRLKNYSDAKRSKIEERIIIIDFLSAWNYKISSLEFVHESITSASKEVEDLRWSYKQRMIIGFKHKNLFLMDSEFPEKKLKRLLRKTFNNYFIKKEIEPQVSTSFVQNIIEIVKTAADQKKGTMVVVTEPEIAQEEIKRLSGQGIQIDTLNFSQKRLKNEIVTLINRLTGIDGAIYLDITSNCYAIGMILDGKAVAEKGNNSRGARYNSAIRYQNLDELKNKSVIIVISEDGMVDIIGDEENEFKLKTIIKEIELMIVNKEHQNALKRIEELIDEGRDYSELYYLRFKIYYELKEYEDALEALKIVEKDAVEKDVIDSTLYFILALLNSKLQRNDAIIANYTKAIEINPEYALAYNNRGIANQNFKKYEEAIADYTKAIEINPEYALAYNNRGSAYGNLDKYEEAIADYTKAIEINPEYASAYNNRGIANKNLEKYEEAVADYTKAIEINPAYTSAYNNRGNVYGKLEKYE